MLTKEIQSVHGLTIYYDETSTKETLLEVIKAMEAGQEDVDELKDDIFNLQSEADDFESDRNIAEEKLTDLEISLSNFKKDIQEADTYVKSRDILKEFINNIE